MQSKPINRYQQIIEKIFFDNYKPGDTAVQFDRTDLTKATAALKLETIKNLGDAIYAMRYRTPLPKKILKTQPHKEKGDLIAKTIALDANFIISFTSYYPRTFN